MLIDATYKLLNQKAALNLTEGSVYESNYNYDLVEWGSAVMADYAYELLIGIKAAKDAAGSNFASDETYITRRDAFLTLIADVDKFKGTNLNFRLGKWTQEARDAATEVEGATSATADWYEFNNARTLITTWGDKVQNSGLKDYSYRSWQGLLKDYYLPRWEYYFANDCNGCDYFFFEWNWAHGKEHTVGQTEKSDKALSPSQKGYSYNRLPEGKTIKEGKKLFGKYLIPITLADDTYYAYRHLTNNLSEALKIEASAGCSINLEPYFGKLADVKVEGDCLEQATSTLKRININKEATSGTHQVTITLLDGTKFLFTVAIM